MPENQPEPTGNDATKQFLAEQALRIGIHIDSSDINKTLDPVLLAIERKLNNVGKASKIESGLFGKDFLKDKVKQLTGFDMSLMSGISNMIKFGSVSKATGADNKEFYNSLNMVGKTLVDLSDKWKAKKKAEQDASDQTKKTGLQLANLDERVERSKGFGKMLDENGLLASQFEKLGPEAATAAEGVAKIGPAAEEASFALEILGSIATLGLAALVAGAALAARTIYQMVMQAISARDEFKKFDQMFGGIGRGGINEGLKSLQALNRSVYDLGFSLAGVNTVVETAVEGGLAWSRALDTTVTRSVLELSGTTGAAKSEIGGMFTELMKTTRISTSSLQEMGNSFVSMNRALKASGNLGQVSFAQFKEGITSSANALGIAASKGDEFTNKMTKDLLALSALASNLSISISGLNAKFEEAGSLITNPDSGFRTLLALSGGANINQMLSNQFNKTDAMLKNITYLQELNKSFGNNTQLTAQFAQQSLGIEKDIAIKMINTRQDTIESMKKAEAEIAGLQTGAMKDAYEKVNSGIFDVWNRIKTMFGVFFQNAFGASSGMQGLVARLEGFLAKFKSYMTEGGWVDKLAKVLDKVVDWIGNQLTDLLNWVGKKLDEWSGQGGGKSIMSSISDEIQKALLALMLPAGNLLGIGFLSSLDSRFQKLFGSKETIAKIENTKNNPTNVLNNPAIDFTSSNQKRESEISSEMSRNEKYKPDQVTYGADAAGNVGFMTIAQKQYALEKEKKNLEAEDRKIQAAQLQHLASIDAKTPANEANSQSRGGQAEQLAPITQGNYTNSDGSTYAVNYD